MKLAIILPTEYRIFCTENKLWISAAHIPRKNNIETDQQSRMLQDTTEWKLQQELFHQIVDKFGKSDIHLFTSRIIRQPKSDVPCHPEPEATFFYMFPPFSFVVLNISQGERGQDRSSYSGTRLVTSVLVLSANADDQP